jgi:predicted nucleic acid-binding protein
VSGALVLDSEGLAKAVQRDREIHEWLTAARDADLPVVTSAAVLVEVIHPRINDAALKWTLSRLTVEPVTKSIAHSAAALLRTADLHGHKYAIDAMLCATALQHPGRLTILTSDTEDIGLLTAEHRRVSVEKV